MNTFEKKIFLGLIYFTQLKKTQLHPIEKESNPPSVPLLFSLAWHRHWKSRLERYSHLTFGLVDQNIISEVF